MFLHIHLYAQSIPSTPALLLMLRLLEKGKIDNIVQKKVFDVLLVVEEETVSKHSEGMRRSVKAQAIICASFIHIKQKSQTLCLFWWKHALK